jgi:SPOR domain
VRALFFALVLANVAFFGWAHWVDTPELAASSPAPDRPVPTLALASSSTAVRPAAAQRCRTLGPFANQAAAQAASAALRTRGIATRDRAVERNVEDGYWVYIGDLGSSADQQRALARLDKGGIHDATLMSDPEDAGRISVGIFTEQARAVRRAEQVRTLGFKPILDLHQRVQRAFWLDMDLHRDQPEPPVTALESASGDAGAGSSVRGIAFSDCPLSDKHG